MLFDSHVHLDDEKFAKDRAEVIRRAIDGGVSHMINIGSDMASSRRSVELAEAYAEIYAAIGVHPHDASSFVQADGALLAEWAAHPKVVAIGEIGLDYYYDWSPRDVQRQCFIAQLDLARQLNMPVIIHDRDAHSDTMQIIKREGKGLIGVFHCFAGSMEMAKELISMGWYIGIDGPVTFKNAAKLPEIAARIPLERLLIETDCPYLTPVPLRGKRNEPANVRHVASHIAALRGIELAALAQAVTQNTCDLFNIKI